MSAAIDFDGVSVTRGDVRVLDDLHLSVQPGETVALVGRSGAGKTTILKLINRLMTPTAGVVRVAGKDTRSWDPIALRRSVGYVIQDVGLFPHQTVAQNIGVVPRLLEWPRERIASRVDALLDLVGLPPRDYASRWPDQLSGGQRQRVGVARALAADPGVLLMDEPFGALDPLTRVELHREFHRIQAEVRKTVVLVTHDMGEAFALADRIGVLADGRMVACAPGADLAATTDERVRLFLDALPQAPRAGGREAAPRS